MPQKTTIIPKAPVAKILAESGGKRVSADAVDELVKVLTEKAQETAASAVKMARHTGRKTVHEDDIKLAARKI